MKKIISIIALLAVVFSIETHAMQNLYSSSSLPAGEDDGHGHTADELPEMKFTKIVDNYESYISISTLIKGQSAHFHLNLTNISNYKPVDGAKVTVTIGDFTTAQKISKGGITHFGYKPNKEGKFNISATVEVDGKVLEFVLGNITVYKSISAAAHAPHEENPDEISLAQKWMWTNNFGVEIVQPAPFDEVIRTRGEILPATNSKSVIIAPTAGTITFTKNLIIGRKLATQEAIGYISGTGLENNIESRLKKLQSQYENAKSNYERNEVLYKDFIVSEQKLKDSYNIYITAKENYYSLSEIYSSKGVKIVAPSSSVITDILVSENQYVEAGTIIATANLDRDNMLQADVSKYNYKKIKNITDANFIPEYSSKTYNVKALGGTRLINSIATRDNNGYIPVYFSLPNNFEVVPYSYSEVYLIVGSKQDIISIPNAAISENEGLYWVYVQINSETFEKRDVILGGGNGERRIVLDGLNPGEVIVTTGSAKVRQSETSGAEIPHGHTH